MFTWLKIYNYNSMEKLNEIQNQENEWSVYLLSCDKTPKVVYIGITNEKYVITRLFRHFVESVTTSPTQNNKLKNEWVKTNWQDIRMTILEHNILILKLPEKKNLITFLIIYKKVIMF